jgi:hypothetical protein
VYLVTPTTTEEEETHHAAIHDDDDEEEEEAQRKRTSSKSSSSCSSSSSSSSESPHVAKRTSSKSSSSSSSSSSESPHVANNSKRARGSGYGLFIQQSGVGALNSQLFPSAARGRLFEVVGYIKDHSPETLHYVKLLFDYRMDQGKVTWSALRCLLQVDSAGQIRVLAIMKVRGGVPYWLNCIQQAGVPTEEGGVREDIPIEISPALGYSFHIPSEGDVCYTKLINNIELGNATAANHWLYTSHSD